MRRYTFEQGGERLDLAGFAARWPAWVGDAAVLRALARAPLGLPSPPPIPQAPEPLFAPWHEAMVATAAPRQRLRLGRGPVAASPERSFGHGRAAFLAAPGWPGCGGCGELLELCCYLAPGDVKPWLRREGALVLMYCFKCHPSSSREGRERAFVRIVEPGCLVTRPAGPSSSSVRTSTTETRGVEVCPPSWHMPEAMQLRFRIDREALGGAADALLGREEIAVEVSGEEEGGDLDDDDQDDTVSTYGEYEAWSDEVNRAGGRGIGALGGYARWDQGDETPDCARCGAPMQHLADWNGEQFLDGALHVFLCDRTLLCGEELAFVAEF